MALSNRERNRYAEILHEKGALLKNRHYLWDEDDQIQDRYLDAAVTVADRARKDLIERMVADLEREMENHPSSMARDTIRLVDIPRLRTYLPKESE